MSRALAVVRVSVPGVIVAVISMVVAGMVVDSFIVQPAANVGSLGGGIVEAAVEDCRRHGLAARGI